VSDRRRVQTGDVVNVLLRAIETDSSTIKKTIVPTSRCREKIASPCVRYSIVGYRCLRRQGLVEEQLVQLKRRSRGNTRRKVMDVTQDENQASFATGEFIVAGVAREFQ
jgi:hypothetical protein